MIIAVASGKGGTGKTMVAVSLALAAIGESERPVRLLDCDAEAPNAGLFLNPDITSRVESVVLVPRVDAAACDSCGACAEACAFHAIASVGGPPLVFPDLCHGCGSCAFVCPKDAISEVPVVIGHLSEGRAGELGFGEARLAVGRSMATPVIRSLKASVSMRRGLTVIDSPPGAACATIEAVKGADVVVLVTEPTPYGLSDLKQAVEVVRDALELPVRVVLNKTGVGDDGVEEYCRSEEIPVVLRIPFEREIAAALSEGLPLVRARPELAESFARLLLDLKNEVTA